MEQRLQCVEIDVGHLKGKVQEITYCTNFLDYFGFWENDELKAEKHWPRALSTWTMGELNLWIGTKFWLNGEVERVQCTTQHNALLSLHQRGSGAK